MCMYLFHCLRIQNGYTLGWNRNCQCQYHFHHHSEVTTYSINPSSGDYVYLRMPFFILCLQIPKGYQRQISRASVSHVKPTYTFVCILVRVCVYIYILLICFNEPWMKTKTNGDHSKFSLTFARTSWKGPTVTIIKWLSSIIERSRIVECFNWCLIWMGSNLWTTTLWNLI